MLVQLKKYKFQLLSIFLLILLAGLLRLYNLGYSEYQDDEKKALISLKKGYTVREFLLSQRKGPMQFLVTEFAQKTGIDKKNELQMRIPFALMSVLAVPIFYLVLAQYVKSEIIRFAGTTLFLVNGFFVGFGRIVQYQNINILFSLLALLMFIYNAKRSRSNLALSLAGVIFFSISLLAHWDAIFFVLPISVLYVQFLLNKAISSKTKVYTTISCFVLGCIILLPFLIPYKSFQTQSPDNLRYFDKRVGLSTYPLDRHKFIFELYNPYFTLYLIGALLVGSLLTIRKSWIFWVWFLINFVSIKFFMQKPGTHIYNYVIPVIFLSTFSLDLLNKKKILFLVSIPVITFFLALLYFQSYTLFVDHKGEYPWDSKVIFKVGNTELKNTEYTDPEVLTFGFPHYRSWKEINNFVTANPDNCSYITNEGKEISQIYMTSGYGIKDSRKCYYIVKVTRPFITGARDAVFAESSGKAPLYTYANPYTNETLVKIYRKNQKKK